MSAVTVHQAPVVQTMDSIIHSLNNWGQEDTSNVSNSLIVLALAYQLQYIAVSETIIISFGS